ncbi:hypothetical protein GA0115254_118528 [Streptomyces sp. Ncost-T10-10d]|nr:hypothetical protein GA0115254_118528 [Streptomyces sp. Ncost-T10-10d]
MHLISRDVRIEPCGRRARCARPDVELPAAHVAGLCRHLDGLPPAVEPAAAWVRVLPVADISRQLRDRFALLRGGARDIPERHRILHAVVERSWNLLQSEGRRCRSAMRSTFSSPLIRLSTAKNCPVTPIAGRTAWGSTTGP